MKLLSFLLCLTLCLIAHAKVSYDGFKMYEVIPRTGLQVKILEGMYTESKIDRVDFWVPPRGINIPVQISVSPKTKIIATLRLMGMDTTLVMDNVQHFIDQQNKVDLKFKPKGKAAEFDYGVYHDLAAINDWITNITTVYADKAKVIEVGKSFEGRPIRLIQIDTGKVQQKNGFFMEGGIHAREWISPATVIYMTGQMLDLYGTDAKITDIVDSYTWYILPVFNVDGYEYTWTKDRNWRKTRSKHGLCHGVDPNRNWDFEWCKGGASKEPCSDTYCGPSAFSEVEVKAVSDFINSHKGTIKAFIDFHSFSQLWMTPWGYTKDLPTDYTQLNAGAKAACDALEVDYGTKYQHGNIADIIYVASGSSADWTYGAEKIKYSYAVELRDTGEYGFLLPADQILPSGKETLEALKALCSYVFNN
ncbi:carboxypeptidase B-like [Mytilus trossulus]|uniref:carboxypeptidase B-like n=1 Tax=Mytilus trossulus TaxID=6551 RepID=UPI003004F5AE